MHYVACICALGSADGYNTESPEHLHIDFAKEAYCASNKHDYVEQMAVWLQRHEAIWLRESYLIWIKNRLGVVAAEKNEDNEDDGNGDGDDLEDVIVNNKNQCNMTINKEMHVKNYSLAKHPPFQNITVNNILVKFSAIDLISALSTFLCQIFPGTTVLPSIHDQFDIYKQLVITLLRNPYLSEHEWTDRIRTLPFVKGNCRYPDKLAHFDTALVIEDVQLYNSDGGISGEFLFNNFL